MATETRERLIDVATAQFAEGGFEGVSIARIAEALGLSKQALLHHFSTKERLYGEVLASISRRFEARVAAAGGAAESRASLRALLLALAQESQQARTETALIVRELLDNGDRARRAGHWYLKAFLETLVDRLTALDPWRGADRESALAAIYQILGAIHYFSISTETLRAMFGDAAFARMESAHERQLEKLIDGVLAAGPAT